MSNITEQQLKEWTGLYNIPVEYVKDFITYFFQPWEAVEWVRILKLNMESCNTIEKLHKWKNYSFSARECEVWCNAFVPLEEAVKWKLQNLSVEEALRWRHYGMKATDYFKWHQLPLYEGDISILLSMDISPEQVLPWIYDGCIEKYNLGIEQVGLWITQGYNVSEVESLLTNLT